MQTSVHNVDQFQGCVLQQFDFQLNSQSSYQSNFKVNILKNIEENSQIKHEFKTSLRNEMIPLQMKKHNSTQIQKSSKSALLSPDLQKKTKKIQSQYQRSLVKIIKSIEKQYIDHQGKQIKAAQIKKETFSIYQNKNQLYALSLMKTFILNEKNHKQIFDACQILDKVCNYLSEKVKKNQSCLFVSCNDIMPIIRGNKNAFNFIVFNLLNMAIEKAVNKNIQVTFYSEEKEGNLTLIVSFVNCNKYSEQYLQLLSSDFKNFIKNPLEFQTLLEQYTPIVIGMNLALNQNYAILSSSAVQENKIQINVKFSFSVDLNQNKVSYQKQYCNDFASIEEEGHEDKSISSLELSISSTDEHSSAASLASVEYSPGKLIQNSDWERDRSYSESQKKNPCLSTSQKSSDQLRLKDVKEKQGSQSFREEEEIASWFCQ